MATRSRITATSSNSPPSARASGGSQLSLGAARRDTSRDGRSILPGSSSSGEMASLGAVSVTSLAPPEDDGQRGDSRQADRHPYRHLPVERRPGAWHAPSPQVGVQMRTFDNHP